MFQELFDSYSAAYCKCLSMFDTFMPVSRAQKNALNVSSREKWATRPLHRQVQRLSERVSRFADVLTFAPDWSGVRPLLAPRPNLPGEEWGRPVGSIGGPWAHILPFSRIVLLCKMFKNYFCTIFVTFIFRKSRGKYEFGGDACHRWRWHKSWPCSPGWQEKSSA